MMLQIRFQTVRLLKSKMLNPVSFDDDADDSYHRIGEEYPPDYLVCGGKAVFFRSKITSIQDCC